MARFLSALFVLLALSSLTKGEICESPKFSAVSHSTTDARLTAESVAQVEITVTCKNGKQPSNLHAEINGQVVPCAQSTSSSGKYYVSVPAATHKQLPKGRTTVKLYDDDSYSALRKARTDEATKAVKPFGEVELYHPGAGFGPWLPSEFVAVILFGAVWWAAYRERSKILA